MTEETRTSANAGSNRHLRFVGGREIAFDSEGFFWEYDDWSESAASELAAQSGLAVLADIHWKVLRFFREFYAYHGRAPLNRELKRGTEISIMDLQALFPEGIKQGARRLAGLPNPKTCN